MPNEKLDKNDVEKALRESTGASTSDIRAAPKALSDFGSAALGRFQTRQAAVATASAPPAITISEARLEKPSFGASDGNQNPSSPPISGTPVVVYFLVNGVIGYYNVLTTDGSLH